MMNLAALLKQLRCRSCESVILDNFCHKATSLVKITNEMITKCEPAVEGDAISCQRFDNVFVLKPHTSSTLFLAMEVVDAPAD
jgi:hypothetical protein